MFDLGWSELLVVAIVALIVIGPKELPGVLRGVGYWMGKVRRMASEFQGQFQEAMREAEMADLKKQVDELTDTSFYTPEFDALGDLNAEPEKKTEAKPEGGEAAAASEPTAGTAPEPASPPATGEAHVETTSGDAAETTSSTEKPVMAPSRGAVEVVPIASTAPAKPATPPESSTAPAEAKAADSEGRRSA